MADSKDSLDKPDVTCLKGKVRQLLWRDPHQLYQRLEAIVKDCVLEQKVKLIKLLKTQAKNPSLAQDFIQSELYIWIWVVEHNMMRPICVKSHITAQRLP